MQLYAISDRQQTKYWLTLNKMDVMRTCRWYYDLLIMINNPRWKLEEPMNRNAGRNLLGLAGERNHFISA